jgi:hypothetical protein
MKAMLCFTTFIVLLAGCADKRPGDNGSRNIGTVQNLSDMGTCNSRMQGLNVYVETEAEFYICDLNVWRVSTAE